MTVPLAIAKPRASATVLMIQPYRSSELRASSSACQVRGRCQENDAGEERDKPTHFSRPVIYSFVCACLCMCLCVYQEARRGSQGSSIAPPISLRQELSLNLELEFSWLLWKPASFSSPPAFVPIISGFIGMCGTSGLVPGPNTGPHDSTTSSLTTQQPLQPCIVFFFFK